MQTWINFWNLFFWIIFASFVINSYNFTKLLFVSELAWLVLYNYSILIGSINDDITILSNAFFILGFAGLEFCIGLILVILFKKILKLDYFDEAIVSSKTIYNLDTSRYTNTSKNVNEI